MNKKQADNGNQYHLRIKEFLNILGDHKAEFIAPIEKRLLALVGSERRYRQFKTQTIAEIRVKLSIEELRDFLDFFQSEFDDAIKMITKEEKKELLTSIRPKKIEDLLN